MIFGISNALRERIDIRAGQVVQSNYYDYPVMRMNEIPNIEVRAISTDNAPTGMGEIGLASMLIQYRPGQGDGGTLLEIFELLDPLSESEEELLMVSLFHGFSFFEDLKNQLHAGYRKAIEDGSDTNELWIGLFVEAEL